MIDFGLRRSYTILALLAALAAGCSGGGGGTGKSDAGTRSGGSASTSMAGQRYVIITNGNSPFWDAVRVGAENAAKDLGVTVDLQVNDGTPQGQQDKLRQIANQGDVVGVGISVTQARAVGVADEMKALMKKGIQCITIDSDFDRELLSDARFSFVGTDNLIGGRELGACARGLRPDGGKFVTFVGIKSAQNAMERIGGFRDGAGDKFEDLDSMGDDLDRSRAKENVRNAIKNHPGLNTLVGIWSYNAPAIVGVVTEQKRRKDFTVVTFDAEPEAIAEMGQGNIDAMVVQNPYEMGYQGMRTLKALVDKDDATLKTMYPDLGQPGGNVYDTGLKVVVPDSDTPLRAEMFGPKTQFMKLSEFRDWLAKYDLKGS